jgi:hypothetical protein
VRRGEGKLNEERETDGDSQQHRAKRKPVSPASERSPEVRKETGGARARDRAPWLGIAAEVGKSHWTAPVSSKIGLLQRTVTARGGINSS